METGLYKLGNEVNMLLVKTQGALAGYAFYHGNRSGIARDEDVARLRDLLSEAEYLSRVLTEGSAQAQDASVMPQ